MTYYIIDSNMQINSFKAKGKKKRKKIIKTNDLLLEKNKEKYDKVKAKNQREKDKKKEICNNMGIINFEYNTTNIFIL